MQLSSDYSNRQAFQRVFSSLYRITARRTSDSFAAIALSTIKDSLKLTYSFDFLNYVRISENEIDIERNILEDIDSKVLVHTFDSIIRVVYTDLGEKAGLFFIKELKEEIGSSLVASLSDHGLNFDLMALEQRHLQRRRSEKKKESQQELTIHLKQDKDQSKINNVLQTVAQESVSTCRIDPKECTCVFIDETGKKISEYCIQEVIMSLINLAKETIDEGYEFDFSDQTIFSFLQLLQSNQEVSIPEVKDQFHFSTVQVDQIIRHLLKKKYLRYKTISQLIITDLGKEVIRRI
jgi:hypothetical protein